MEGSDKQHNIQIVEAQPPDFEAIATIYNEYILRGNSTLEEEIHRAEHIGQWVEKFNEWERLYVLKREESIIGWGIIKRYSDRAGYRFAAETAVFLAETELRKGYGSKMKQFLIEASKALGYHHLVAKIFASNEASMEYNRKLGYELVGIQKEIGYKNGKWQDIAIMQYVIK